MGNIDRADTFPNGIALGFEDDVAVFHGSLDPVSNSEVAPIGSLYMRTNGELWVKTTAPNNGWTLIGDSSGTGAGVGIQLKWRFDTATAAADPTSGRFRYDNSTLASVTNIYFSDNADNGVDTSSFLNSIPIGSLIYIQTAKDASQHALFKTTGTPVDNTGWFTIPVAVQDSGTLHSNNEKCGSIFAIVGGGVDPSTTITGGEGLTGGGDLTANRVIDMDIPGLAAQAGFDVDNDLIVFYDTSLGEHRYSTFADLPTRGQGMPFTAGRNQNVSSSYLNWPGGVPSNTTPLIVPVDCELTAMTLATSGPETWTLELHENNILVPGATLASGGAQTAVDNTYTGITFLSGAALSLFCNGSSISKPQVIIVLRRI
jgi:hypothetical protein